MNAESWLDDYYCFDWNDIVMRTGSNNDIGGKGGKEEVFGRKQKVV